MYKIFTIFIAVIVTTCLAQRAYRYRNKRIPYEDDDYREENDDDRPNDIRDARPYDLHSNRFNQLHADMNRQTHFDVGGGRDPPTIPSLYDAYRGYGIPKPGLQSYGPQGVQPQHPQLQAQPQPQPQPQPTPLSAAAPGAAGGYDGGRANAQFGYSPYGQYGYNPYGYGRYPAYGWNRPAAAHAPPSNPWNPFSLFPFNLLLGGGGGGGGNGGAYRPWWSGNRWGLFF